MKIRLHHTNDESPSVIIPMGGTLDRNRPDPRQVSKGLTRVYDFKRDEHDALICDVTHDGDLKRFLSLIDGFSPYGDESISEARETYAWTGEHPEDDDAPQLAAGQPAIVDVFVDDDEPDMSITDDDDDDDNLRDSGLQTGLPDVPGKDADGDAWMAYGKTLPGITNPKDHNQLVQYAAANYGADLKAKGTLKMLQEIAALQAAAA